MCACKGMITILLGILCGSKYPSISRAVANLSRKFSWIVRCVCTVCSNGCIFPLADLHEGVSRNAAHRLLGAGCPACPHPPEGSHL